MARYFDEEENWYIAGYGDTPADWIDLEEEAERQGIEIWELDFDAFGIAESDIVTIAITDEDGETHYFTAHGPFDRDYDFGQEVEDFIEQYLAG